MIQTQNSYVAEIPCALIVQVFNQDIIPSEHDGNIVQMAEDISVNGLRPPLMVNHRDGEYRLLAGEQHFHAIQLLKWERVECVVFEDLGYVDELRCRYSGDLPVKERNSNQRIVNCINLIKELEKLKKERKFKEPI